MAAIVPQQLHGPLHHCPFSSLTLQAWQPLLPHFPSPPQTPTLPPVAATNSAWHQCPSASKTSMEIQGKKAQSS